jgi:hypothetical protein
LKKKPAPAFNRLLSFSVLTLRPAFIKMAKKILGLILVVLFISCAKDSNPAGALFGTYAGAYQRTGTGGITDTATVRIVFVGSNFSGQSTSIDRTICNGNYQVAGDSINFTNNCSIPDTSLLLVNKYKMTAVGDSLYFSRISNGNVYYEDQFNLKVQ